MRARVTVNISLRPGILDPEGGTIEKSLPALGFEGVSDVRVGKQIRMAVDGPSTDAISSKVEKMCQNFLANPVIEDFDFVVETETPLSSSTDDGNGR